MRRFTILLLLIAALLLVTGCSDQGVVVVTATLIPATQTPFIVTATADAVTPDFATNTPAPTTYDQSCPGVPGNGFVIKNTNPCLIGSIQEQAEDGTQQCRPEQFVLYSDAVTVDGYADGYSAHANILCEGDGYRFPIALINGEWGYTTLPTTLGSGCHIIKMTGIASIYDPDEHPENYMAASYLQISGARGEIDLQRQQIPIDDDFEIVWPFRVNTPASVIATTTLMVGWGSAGDGSLVTVRSISISEAPNGYCQGEVPEL